MNRVTLMGNLGSDAELKVLASGQALLKFRLATSETWKDKDTGEKKEKTEWHDCTLWGKRAESLAPHLTKGSKLLVEGSLETTSYEKDGEKRYRTGVKVTGVEFAGGGKGKTNEETTTDGGTDEIPF